MSGPLTLMVEASRVGMRTAAYWGLGEVTRRIVRSQASDASPFKPTRPVPSQGAQMAGIRRLIASDMALVRDGFCAPFVSDERSALDWLARAREMVDDLPATWRRSRERDGQDVRRQPEAQPAARSLGGQGALPDYYLQNFHFQTGGYLTEASARLYDVQVETLFLGTASLMRRQALRRLHRSQLLPA